MTGDPPEPAAVVLLLNKSGTMGRPVGSRRQPEHADPHAVFTQFAVDGGTQTQLSAAVA